ncbi:MAG TPA: hypothetical protein VM370_12815 [Candidatus Thermoplasmatota archaeon]|nr:hypothetical protein [Candidatus Thermoplasmatota archaeon]
MIPALEAELAAPVGAWFVGQGYEAFFEVHFNGRIADVIAVKGDEVVAVELKLRDFRQAHRQAIAYQVGCHRSYVGVPLETALQVMRRDRHAFERSGTGLLAIEGDEVRELLPARLHEARHLPFMADALRALRGG